MLGSPFLFLKMNMEIVKYKKSANCQKEIRMEDKHGHFLGKIQDGLIHVYCKRCKDFYVIQISGGGDVEKESLKVNK